MDISKIVLSLGIILFLSSCNSSQKSAMVSQEKYDQKIQEYTELNNRQAAIIEDNIEKSEVINNVVTELRQLTGMTLILKQDIVEGNGQYSQSQEIQQRLKLLKQKLNDLSSDVTRNKSNAHLISTIENLHSMIEQKDAEIVILQGEIKNQKEKIIEQQNTIDEQHEELIAKNRELQSKQREILTNQRNSWYRLGRELYDAAQSLPEVKGKKDKNNVSNSKYYILNKSKECLEQAELLGHPSAKSLISTINAQLHSL